MQRALLMILICFTSWSFAKAEEVPLDAWVGKDPFKVIGGTTFFYQPRLRSTIEALTNSFPPEPKKILVPWPVRRTDDLIVVQFCDINACATKNYALILDARTGDLGFCSYSESNKTFSYTLKFGYQRSNAVQTMTGILSNALADGCLEQDTAKLGKIWENYLFVAR